MKCCICGKEIEGYGNNPFPIAGKSCCDECNRKVVVPFRMFLTSMDNGNVGMLIKRDHIELIKMEKPLTLKQMQVAVEGLIEVAPVIFPGFVTLVNEEGRIHQLPFNEIGLKLFETDYVGNVLLIPEALME